MHLEHAFANLDPTRRGDGAPRPDPGAARHPAGPGWHELELGGAARAVLRGPPPRVRGRGRGRHARPIPRAQPRRGRGDRGRDRCAGHARRSRTRRRSSFPARGRRYRFGATAAGRQGDQGVRRRDGAVGALELGGTPRLRGPSRHRARGRRRRRPLATRSRGSRAELLDRDPRRGDGRGREKVSRWESRRRARSTTARASARSKASASSRRSSASTCEPSWRSPSSSRRQAIAFLNDAEAFLLGEGVGGSGARPCASDRDHARHRPRLGVPRGREIVRDGSGVPPREICTWPFRGGPVEDSISGRAICAPVRRRHRSVEQIQRGRRGRSARARRRSHRSATTSANSSRRGCALRRVAGRRRRVDRARVAALRSPCSPNTAASTSSSRPGWTTPRCWVPPSMRYAQRPRS